MTLKINQIGTCWNCNKSMSKSIRIEVPGGYYLKCKYCGATESPCNCKPGAEIDPSCLPGAHYDSEMG